MDFFSAQDKARKNTGRLISLFVLAVISLIIMTNLLVMLVFGMFSAGSYNGGAAASFNWQVFIAIGAGVLLVICGGTYYKINALSGGGDAVAAMFNAEPVFDDERDFYRKRLVNIVDEMAIASGTPVPQVYVLNEEGINAFAAGFTASDAVIAVTEGALRSLNREQLQGIIAHEFSHILNGDMRINIRLVGILHGILLLGIIGRQMLRGNRHSSRNKSGGAAILLGIGLIIIGYVGTFFGNLIKAAVSRQREFLADAAAVQFTRNPDGIGGALLQIGARSTGSLLRHPKSEQLSHAYFSQGVTVRFSSLFATHPPLAVRIKSILPAWDGLYPVPSELGRDNGQAAAMEGAATKGFAAQTSTVSRQTPVPGDVAFAAGSALLYGIPEQYRKAAKDPYGARALICCLLLDDDALVRDRQLHIIKSTGDRGVHAEMLRLMRNSVGLQRKHKLPLLELALTAFRQLSREQCGQFLKNLDELIRADGRITLFEWCVRTIVVSYLREYFSLEKEGSRQRSISGAPDEVAVVLSALVHRSEHSGLDKREVFAKALEQVRLPDLVMLSASEAGLKRLDAAVRILRQLRPRDKASLFAACRAIVYADSDVDPKEAELLRAVAAILAIPVPPVSGAG